ncbi:MAG: cellulose 1,4-beta-cellobiosidase [Gaiellaceae bacterium]|nr:cellulose 1,4-beta-cellobiosidase [Gaiellaceae bacterium]
MKRLLVALALCALGSTAPAQASTPLPWCGADSAAADRVPDARPGFAVHVAYVRDPGAPDRLGFWAPRIVGDMAAIDAWWRGQDATRTPRFDLFPGACSTPFGALDITAVTLPQSVPDVVNAFTTIRLLLAVDHDFNQVEKAYLVYYDGPTGQTGENHVCGQGTSGGKFLPGFAVVYLDSCEAEETDSLRPVVAIHELVHVLGAVASTAPHHCLDGHVCDAENDLMNASLSGNELEAHVLDAGRDDYYGHAGTWADAQDSLFLERLDSADRAAPSTPTGLTATDRNGLVRLSWQPSADDVGPVSYRVYQDDRFLRQLPTASTTLPPGETETSSYSVRAADPVGHLSPPVTIRYRLGLGVVDAQGRLVRDTVPPPAVRSIAIRLTARAVVLSWPAVRDPGGVRAYRVKLGSRTLTVTRPTVTIARSRVRTAVELAAVDRGGNVGPATVVPLRRLR